LDLVCGEWEKGWGLEWGAGLTLGLVRWRGIVEGEKKETAQGCVVRMCVGAMFDVRKRGL